MWTLHGSGSSAEEVPRFVCDLLLLSTVSVASATARSRWPTANDSRMRGKPSILRYANRTSGCWLLNQLNALWTIYSAIDENQVLST